MSDILSTYFSNKNIYSSAMKNLNSNKEKIKLINCGLVLSERNILTIKDSKFPKIKSIDSNEFKNTALFSNTFIQKKFKNKNIDILDEKKINNFKYFNNYSNKSNINKIIFRNNDEKLNNIHYNLKIKTFNNQKKKNPKKKIIYSYSNKNLNKNKEDIKTPNNNKKENKTISYNTDKPKSNNNNYTNVRSINPKKDLELKLKTEPNKIFTFKSFDALIKNLNNKKDYKEKILNNIIQSNKNKYNLKQLNQLNVNYNYFKSHSNDLKKKEKIYLYNNNNNFIFSRNKNNFSKNNTSIGNIAKTKNKIYKIEIYNKNKDLISFDEKMNNLMNSTEKTIKYLNKLSGKNETIIKKINILFNNLNLSQKDSI